MNVLTMVDWTVFLAFAGGIALGIVTGWLLRSWRDEGATKPVPVAGDARALPYSRRGLTAASSDELAARGEPLAAPTAPVAAAQPRSVDATGGHETLESIWHEPGDGPSILLVDDRLELLAVHAAYLRKHGYRILLAENGHAALAFARSYHPALIVLDHSMPDRTGVEVARELKADPATAHIPILFMTAHSYGAVGAAAIAAGCAVFLPKPVDPSRLLREIEARAPRH
jgi:CheY-like chemotaxis protein